VTSREFAPWPDEPHDVHHPTCNVWISNDPCNCWHEEERSLCWACEPDQKQQPEPIQLPSDDDLDEAS
jgi:hypothetical protein